MKPSTRLRCYCCGEPIGDRIALVGMGTDHDRVLVMLPEHVERAADARTIIHVRREKKA